MKKLLLFLVLFLSLTVFLAACGSDDTIGESDNSQNGSEGEAGLSDFTYSIQLGHNVPAGTVNDQAAHKFKELIEEKTNNQITVEVFPNQELGNEIDMVENMGMGAIDMVIPGDGVFGTYVPEFQGLLIPFLISDMEHMDRVYNGEIGEELNQAFIESVNSRVLAYFHRGARNLTANEAIRTPEEIEGMKLRTITNPLVVEAWSALGANPTPIDFGELYVSLQQGVVDGQENPFDNIYNAKFFEVQSHVMLTEHTYSPYMLMINNDLYESFPDDIRVLFDEAVTETAAYQQDLEAEMNEEYKNILADEGMEIVEVDKASFQQLFMESDVEDRFADQWIPNLLDRVRELQ
ncbi:TRAP transporter substrate-binding protein [Alkalihalobacillus oceani]|uniref:TRAP transporter substrate-binding protein n=1 Tax=Halalkalibacter oceani TaxID=1653776 RepID=UPI00203A7E72|nr:TRAP transporter substrate-binding protein [Halalkalibacter oceani]MCM3763238.1 TRAP transporter substrate-binding protein [Halalkalibacter oceani]